MLRLREWSSPFCSAGRGPQGVLLNGFVGLGSRALGGGRERGAVFSSLNERDRVICFPGLGMITWSSDQVAVVAARWLPVLVARTVERVAGVGSAARSAIRRQAVGLG